MRPLPTPLQMKALISLIVMPDNIKEYMRNQSVIRQTLFDTLISQGSHSIREGQHLVYNEETYALYLEDQCKEGKSVLEGEAD